MSHFLNHTSSSSSSTNFTQYPAFSDSKEALVQENEKLRAQIALLHEQLKATNSRKRLKDDEIDHTIKKQRVISIADLRETEERHFPGLKLAQTIEGLRQIREIRIPITGQQKTTSFFLPLDIQNEMLIYKNLGNFKERDTAIEIKIPGTGTEKIEDNGTIDKATASSFITLLAYRRANKETANLRTELKKLPEAILEKPEILDEFLALCDRNVSVGDEVVGAEIILEIKQAIIASLLEDRTGDRFTGYLELARYSNHAFIRDALEEALDQLTKEDHWGRQGPFYAILDKVFVYAQQDRSPNYWGDYLLDKALDVLPQICKGLVKSSEDVLPASLPKEQFLRLLEISQSINESCYVAIITVLVKKELSQALEQEKWTQCINKLTDVASEFHHPAAWFSLGKALLLSWNIVPQDRETLSMCMKEIADEFHAEYEQLIVETVASCRTYIYDEDLADSILSYIYDDPLRSNDYLILYMYAHMPFNKHSHKYFEKLLKIERNWPLVSKYVDSLIKAKAIEKASQVLMKEMDLIEMDDPTSSIQYYSRRGKIHMLLGKDQDAIDDLTRSLEIWEKAWDKNCDYRGDDEFDIDSMLEMRSKLYFNAGRFNEALADLYKIFYQDYYNLSRMQDCYLQLGFHSRASDFIDGIIEDYAKANRQLEIVDKLNFHLVRFKTYQKQNKIEETQNAFKMYNEARQESSQLADLSYSTLSRIRDCYLKGHHYPHDFIERIIQDCAKENKQLELIDKINLYFVRYETYLLLGMKSEAEAALAEIIALNAGDTLAHAMCQINLQKPGNRAAYKVQMARRR